MTFTPKVRKKSFCVKFHSECVFLGQANKKAVNSLNSGKLEALWDLKYSFSKKNTSDFKYSLFHLFSLN